MRTYFLLAAFILPSLLFAQNNDRKIARAFPITDYIVDLNDSLKVIQIKAERNMITTQQFGLIRGKFDSKMSDTLLNGLAQCNLIKDTYYYFSLNYKDAGAKPKAGDLLYVLVDKAVVYDVRILQIAAHYISLEDLFGDEFYDIEEIFTNWSGRKEKEALDSMVSDIRSAGELFLESNPSVNKKIKSGPNAGKMVLNTMTTITTQNLKDFLDYMLARPVAYAGNKWKVSEIFATWLLNGSPRE